MPSSVTIAPAPFRLFDVELVRRAPLSPNVVRFTFAGDTLDRFADNGLDQRIKLLFPTAGDGLDVLLAIEQDWYEAWRSLPDDDRPPMRTYTVRAVRAAEREIDVDIVLHGLVGVASSWATTAPLGSRLVVCGPNAEHDGFHGGVDFLPPAHTDRLLIAGDETALPAIANILEQLPPSTRGSVLVEVPDARDAAAVPGHPGVDVIVVGRGGGAHGEALIPLVHEHAARLLAQHAADASAGGTASPDPFDDVDVDLDTLWEAPSDEHGHAAVDVAPLYAWLAGEAGVIKLLRRHLVSECGLDRKTVAFMGYWRLGRTEEN